MKCNSCNQSSFSSLISFDDKKISVKRCQNCSLISLYPKNKPKVISDEYINLDDKFVTYIQKNRSSQYKKDLSIIKKYIKKGKLLDIGSSYGFFVNEANKAGFEAEGIDPSKTATLIAKKKFPKINTVMGEFESQKITNKYDVITLYSVLEHTVDPSFVLNKINKILRNKGIVNIRVPDSDGVLVKIIWAIHKFSFGKITKPSKSLYLINNSYKHYYHFNKKSLLKILRKYNFEILEYYRENSLNPKSLKKRAEVGSEDNQLSFLNIAPIRILIQLILFGARIFKKGDEIVIFAYKND